MGGRGAAWGTNESIHALKPTVHRQHVWTLGVNPQGRWYRLPAFVLTAW